MDKEAKEKEALKKCTLEEGGYSTRKGRGNVQGLLWKQIRANGNRGKRRFTITKAIKLLEITTPYTCRILLQTALSSFH